MINIKEAKQLRVEISKLQERSQKLYPATANEYTDNVLGIVDTRLQEARMWLGIYLKEVEQINPYTESENPENNIIHPEIDV